MAFGEIPLSKYGLASAVPSPANRMMDAFAADFRDGVDINLGVGYVDEATIPSSRLAEALDGVLRDPAKYRYPFNYGGPRGSPNLVASLKKHLASRRHGAVPPEVLERNRVVIGPSGVTSLLEAIGHIVEPGIIVTSDPLYYIYAHFLERLGFKVLAVPEDDEGLDAGWLEKRLASLGKRASKVRFIYVVTVNNPTCTILSNTRRRRLLGIASGLSRRFRHRVPLFLDKAYEDLVHDTDVDPLESLLPHDTTGLAYELGTLSKVLAPALRIGYLVGPDSPFLSALVQKTSDAGFSAPLITQEMASYMLDHHIAEQGRMAVDSYQRKARTVRMWIERELGSFLEKVQGGKAGFYYYLTFKKIDTREGSPFHRILSDASGPAGSPPKPRVVYLPGSFCVHPKGAMVERGSRQLRLSYAYEGLENIKKALEIMGMACMRAIQGS